MLNEEQQAWVDRIKDVINQLISGAISYQSARDLLKKLLKQTPKP